jgi:hypothetical protein
MSELERFWMGTTERLETSSGGPLSLCFTKPFSEINLRQVTTIGSDLCGVIQGGGLRLEFDARLLSQEATVLRVVAHTMIALMPEPGLSETVETLSSYIDFYKDDEQPAIPRQVPSPRLGVAGQPVHSHELVLE